MKWKKFGTRQSTILLFTFSHIVFTETLEHYLGLGYSRRVAVSENGMVTGYCYEKDFKDFEKILTDKIIKEKDFIKENINLFHKTVDKLKKHFNFVKSIDLKNLSNKELYELLSEIEKDYKTFCMYGPLTGRIISGAFEKNILKEAEKLDLNINEIQEHISQLVIPVGEGININEEKDLIKITEKIDKQPGIKKIFLENKDVSQIISGLKTEYNSFYKEIYAHYEKYTWLPVFLENPAWPLSYFIKKMIELLKNKNYILKFEEIEDTSNKISVEQKKLIKNLKLSPEIVKFIYQAGQCLTLRTLFGQRLGYMNYNFNYIYKEIAKRYKFNLKDFKYLSIQEIHNFLLTGKKIDLSIIKKREKFCVLDSRPGKHRILLNEEAKKLTEEIEKSSEEFINKTGELKGNIANKGKARGKVRIISRAGDIQKFKNGEILVASMTSVDTIPAIRKARALITDEGGLTCHAAIVSREFNKPCIIGTKVATKFLKNGDLVEVDASVGIIRKLPK